MSAHGEALAAVAARLAEQLEVLEAWMSYALPILRDRRIPPAEQLDDGVRHVRDARDALAAYRALGAGREDDDARAY